MKNIKIEIKWGIIFTVITLLWSVLEKSSGLHDEHIDKHPFYTNFFAIIAVITFVIALQDKKKNHYGGVMNWQQGFISGLIISAVVALLSPLAMYITFEYISPNYFTNVINYTVDRKIHSREAAESFFNLNSYMMQGIVGSLSMGVVTSAIVALLVKSRKKVVS